MIHYEFPLNEKTRKFLRLEEIFLKCDAQFSSKVKYKESDLFETLFNLMATASRSDLKIELIQEIERQKNKYSLLAKTRGNLTTLKELNALRNLLEKTSIKPGYYFGEDKFLQEIKARSDSPYGIVWTDFPEIQCWLQSESLEARKNYFKEKFTPFLPIKKTIIYLTNLLRINTKMELITIDNLTYQAKLDSTIKNDLVIIQTQSKPTLFPSLSSNKYAININFISPKKTTNLKSQPIKFKIGITAF